MAKLTKPIGFIYHDWAVPFWLTVKDLPSGKRAYLAAHYVRLYGLPGWKKLWDRIVLATKADWEEASNG